MFRCNATPMLLRVRGGDWHGMKGPDATKWRAVIANVGPKVTLPWRVGRPPDSSTPESFASADMASALSKVWAFASSLPPFSMANGTNA